MTHREDAAGIERQLRYGKPLGTRRRRVSLFVGWAARRLARGVPFCHATFRSIY